MDVWPVNARIKPYGKATGPMSYNDAARANSVYLPSNILFFVPIVILWHYPIINILYYVRIVPF